MARIAKGGGTILTVGEGLSEQLGQICREHPQIQIWDDKQGPVERKVVPNNTRAIMYNKFVSHATLNSLRKFAEKRPVTLFPMLSTREIKEALQLVVDPTGPIQGIGSTSKPEILYSNRPTPVPDTTPVAKEPLDVKDKEPMDLKDSDLLDPSETKEKELAQKPEKLGSGVLIASVAKHYNRNIDYSVKGSLAAEGRRLLELLEKEGIPTTLASVSNRLSYVVKNMASGSRKPKTEHKTEHKTAHKTVVSNNDDFAEAEKMLADARAAIDLLLDFIPKLRKEMGIHRKKQQRMREILGEDSD